MLLAVVLGRSFGRNASAAVGIAVGGQVVSFVLVAGCDVVEQGYSCLSLAAPARAWQCKPRRRSFGSFAPFHCGNRKIGAYGPGFETLNHSRFAVLAGELRA